MSSTGPTATFGIPEELALTQAIINLVISNRSQLYACPQLTHVSGNGGDKINKKIQQILKRLETSVAGGSGLTAAAVASLKGNRGTGGSKGTPSPKGKGKVAEQEAQGGKQKNSPGKKRKVVEDEDELDTDE